MAQINSTPYSASLRFKNTEEENAQTLRQVHPSLSRQALDSVMLMINGIRRTDQAVTGGYYTVMDELKEA